MTLHFWLNLDRPSAFHRVTCAKIEIGEVLDDMERMLQRRPPDVGLNLLALIRSTYSPTSIISKLDSWRTLLKDQIRPDAGIKLRTMAPGHAS